MAPDDRRRAIVGALLPLLLERGGEVSTRDIAQAAGIAEGTIFRVFPDKRALLLAAAEEAINPADGQAAFDEAMAGATGLREKVVRATERVMDRMHLTMTVMSAVRPQLIKAFHEEQERGGSTKIGPPAFVVQAQEDLHHRLTGLFEPHRDELVVEPTVAAMALRSLVFGASRPELGMAAVLTPEQVADIVLGGVLRREA
jgi:AcrR family transcriptional regulator